MDTDLLMRMRKFLTPEIVYGEGALELAGQHALNLGASKVMLVSDPGVRDCGWVDRVEARLQEAGLAYITFFEVTPNPKDIEVMRGAQSYLQEGCDLIIAVGGGSPMDCAKGIGVVATNGGSILDYEGINEVPKPIPPLVFIPTTAGTSADVSQFAIINDTSRAVKIAIVSKMVIPDIALVDPATTVTMPPDLTAATGMDALCHAVESFVSTASSPLTDMAAQSAVTLIFENLPGAFQEPKNMVYRDNMMMASLMAGLAFSNASLGIVHAMAHSLGGAHDLPHGECNALLLEKAVVYNYPAAQKKYDQLAPLIGIDLEADDPSQNADRLVEEITSLRRQLGITRRLETMGVALADLRQLAGFAFNDPCLATNPRVTNPEDIEQLYREIF